MFWNFIRIIYLHNTGCSTSKIVIDNEDVIDDEDIIENEDVIDNEGVIDNEDIIENEDVIDNEGVIDNEDIIENEDVIDLKDEPVEVSDYLVWVCARTITSVVASVKWKWVGTVIYFSFCKSKEILKIHWRLI